MKLNTHNKSIVETLTHILKGSLPNASESGLARHVRLIKPDPISKGKAVVFKWNGNDLKATENLSVYELSFYNEWIKTKDTAEVEQTLKAFHDRMYAVVPVQPIQSTVAA